MYLKCLRKNSICIKYTRLSAELDWVGLASLARKCTHINLKQRDRWHYQGTGLGLGRLSVWTPGETTTAGNSSNSLTIVGYYRPQRVNSETWYLQSINLEVVPVWFYLSGLNSLKDLRERGGEGRRARCHYQDKEILTLDTYNAAHWLVFSHLKKTHLSKCQRVFTFTSWLLVYVRRSLYCLVYCLKIVFWTTFMDSFQFWNECCQP